MVDDIEMARPKGLLILFTSFKMLDILPDSEFRHVVNAMRAYVETGSEPEGLELVEQVAFESQREAMNGSIETYQRSIFANRQNGKKAEGPEKPLKPTGLQKNPQKPMGFPRNPQKPIKPIIKTKIIIIQILKYLIVVALKRCPLQPRTGFHRLMLKQ